VTNPRTSIETGVIELLAPLTRAEGRYLKAVDHYNGELLGKEGLDDIRTALLGRSPGVLVTTGDSTTVEHKLDRRNVIERFQVHLFVISTNWGSDKAQRVGDEASEFDPTLDPGINQMLWDIRGLLERQKPMDGAQFLEHGDDAVIVPGGRGFTMWRARFSVAVHLTIPRVTGVPITEYEALHNIKPLVEPVPLEGEPLINPVITVEGTIP
jgi:hypothetical protein